MKIKRKKVSMKEEQKIITNMITSDEFLLRTKGIIQARYFESQYSRAVASWVLDYFRETNSCPGKDIQDIYIKKRSQLEDEEEVELVSEFLQELSNNWEESQLHNITYEVQNAIKYIKIQQLKQLKNQLETCITEGVPEQGETYLSKFKQIKETQSTGVDLFEDNEKIKAAFNEKEDVLFWLQGDLGRAIGAFRRGDFVGIMGGPKSTKSFCSWYIARRAVLLGLRVFIANFEMTENQYIRRAWQSLRGRPKHKSNITIPYFEEKEDDKYRIKYREEYKEGVELNTIKKRQKIYKGQTKQGKIKIETFISGVSTFSDVKNKLTNLEYYEGFCPDVIIFDYADIMAPEIKGDKRHQIDDIWIKIRGLASERNCLCITPSQVESKSWGKDIKGNAASENKMKAAHVTKMFALNSTENEMDKGIIRVQSLFEREGKRYIRQVLVLHALDIGRWYLDSKFREKIIFENED